MLPEGVRSLPEIAEYPEARDRAIHSAGLLEFLLKSITPDPEFQNLELLIEHHRDQFSRFRRVDEARKIRNKLIHGDPHVTPGQVLAAESSLYQTIVKDILPLCSESLQIEVRGNALPQGKPFPKRALDGLPSEPLAQPRRGSLTNDPLAQEEQSAATGPQSLVVVTSTAETTEPGAQPPPAVAIRESPEFWESRWPNGRVLKAAIETLSEIATYPHAWDRGLRCWDLLTYLLESITPAGQSMHTDVLIKYHSSKFYNPAQMDKVLEVLAFNGPFDGNANIRLVLAAQTILYQAIRKVLPNCSDQVQKHALGCTLDQEQPAINLATEWFFDERLHLCRRDGLSGISISHFDPKT